MRLLLVRHGQTPANVRGELDTAAPGPGLTRLGRRQAKAIPAALATEPIAGIYGSVLVRTQQTADPLARDRRLPVIVRTGLHEIAAGDLERHSDWPSVQRYLEVISAWGIGELDVAMPGGTDGHEFFDRIDGALATIAAEHDDDATVAVVNHSAAIRVWTAARAHNIEPVYAARARLENAEIVVVTGSPAGGWQLESWGGSPPGATSLERPTT
jgi:probable phosphoglycerate mutase